MRDFFPLRAGLLVVKKTKTLNILLLIHPPILFMKGDELETVLSLEADGARFKPLIVTSQQSDLGGSGLAGARRVWSLSQDPPSSGGWFQVKAPPQTYCIRVSEGGARTVCFNCFSKTLMHQEGEPPA